MRRYARITEGGEFTQGCIVQVHGGLIPAGPGGYPARYHVTYLGGFFAGCASSFPADGVEFLEDPMVVASLDVVVERLDGWL